MPAALAYVAMMSIAGSPVMSAAVALGVGLLVGAERERRKGEGPARAAAGIRTFAVVALLGAVAMAAGGGALLAVATLGVFALSIVAYRRAAPDDPGLTTEAALAVTAVLGGLAMPQPGLAAAIGVVVALLLASRDKLHRFVRVVLTEDELHDAITLAAAAVVVLPLVPNEFVGPFGALNPRRIWMLVVLVMLLSGAGHVALRALGPRMGLPLAGFASGFVSSAATVSSMGHRARLEPALLQPAAAGAVLSSVATIVQLVLVLATVSPLALRVMARPLLAAGVAAVAVGAFLTHRAARAPDPPHVVPGRPFRMRMALAFAALFTAVALLSAALQHWLGAPGLLGGVALAGFADAHSTAASVASLVATGALAPDAAVLPILVAVSTNSVTKTVLAVASGGRAFAARVVPGTVLVIAAAWAAMLLS
jgi:uncharacterized membrane protein (DUF4010 family)